MHEEKTVNKRAPDGPQDGAIPTYLMDREKQTRAKVLSNMIKQKRKEKAGKWNVPLPKVRAVAEEEVFKVMKSGKRKSGYFTWKAEDFLDGLGRIRAWNSSRNFYVYEGLFWST